MHDFTHDFCKSMGEDTLRGYDPIPMATAIHVSVMAQPAPE